MTLYPTAKEVNAFLESNSFLSCKAFAFVTKVEVAVEVAGIVKVSGVEAVGECSHRKHPEMFGSDKALFLKAVIKKKKIKN